VARPSIRVLVVAEQESLRSELPRVLSAQSLLEVLGVVPPGASGEALAAEPEAIAIATGPEEAATPITLATVRRAHPSARIVFFTGAQDLLARLADLASPARAPVVYPTGLTKRNEVEVEVVVIGSSAGGPKALLRVVADLPADLSVPVALVQHMPMMFTRILAERLSAVARIPVAEAVKGAALAPGRVWVAPGGVHLEVRRSPGGVVMETHLGPEENSCRPSADVLFRSTADAYGSRVLAVVLSGMGKDGQRGCEAIRASGGKVIVQDQATSVVWGMPGAVSRAGLADAVLPVEEIGAEIARRTRAGVAVLGG
jgi:chemotaxis response regulator CheB